jgi:hypothetical protein
MSIAAASSAAAGAGSLVAAKSHSLGGYASAHMHPDTGNFSGMKAAATSAVSSLYAREKAKMMENHHANQQPVHVCFTTSKKLTFNCLLE